MGRAWGRQEGPDSDSQELLGGLSHLLGDSVSSLEGGAPKEGVAGTRRGSPAISPGVWHSLRGHGAIPTA